MAINPEVRRKLEEAKRKALEKKEAEAKNLAQENGLTVSEQPAVTTTLLAPSTPVSGVSGSLPTSTSAVVATSSSLSASVQPANLPSSIEAQTPAVEPINEQHRQILESLENLKALLIASDPDFALLLQQIHSQLIQHPELTHILTDDQISVAYQAMMKKNQVHIAVKTSKAKAPKGGKAKDKGLLDDGTSVLDFL